MQEKTVEELIMSIAERSNKEEEEIRELISSKSQKFSGLLTEEGAAYLVEKELGLKNESAPHLSITEASDGKKGISLKGRIESMYPVKEFDKGGKKGKLRSFILSDGSGEIRVTLWNDHVDTYKLKQGDEVTLTSCIISLYNEKKQATLGYGGIIEVTKEGVIENTKIADLKSGLTQVHVVGKITRKFPIKEFESKDRKGKLVSFQFGDDTALIRTTAWNDKANELDQYAEGDVIEIHNAYTKEGKYGVELHLGYPAEIQKSSQTITTKANTKETATKRNLNELIEKENAIITTTFVKALSGNLYYLVCEKCGKKVTKTDNGVFCETDGEVQGKKNAVLSLTIEDDTAQTQLTLFGDTALTFIGKTQTEFEKELDEKSVEAILSEITEKNTGKKVIVYGYARLSKFSGGLEFVAKELLI